MSGKKISEGMESSVEREGERGGARGRVRDASGLDSGYQSGKRGDQDTASILRAGWDGVGAWVGFGKLVTTRAGGGISLSVATSSVLPVSSSPVGGLHLMCLASGIFSHTLPRKALSISFTLRHK